MTKYRQHNKRDLTKGDIVSHALRLSIPMTIGIGAIVSFSLADTYFISLLGAKELSAIGYAMPITMLFFNAIFGFAIAMSAVVSRKMGAKLLNETRSVVTMGLGLVVIVSILMSGLGLLFLDVLLSWAGADEEMKAIARPYMHVWLWGFVFLSLPLVANSAIRGSGDAVWPAVVMVSVAVLNLILDPILMFGVMGFQGYGLVGAGYASVIAYGVSTIMALSILAFREKVVDVTLVLNKPMLISSLKALLMIAIPVSIANVIYPIVSYGYTAIISTLGHGPVAGLGVVARFEGFIMIPIMAAAGGIAPLIGQNHGAGYKDRVVSALRMVIRFGIFYGMIAAALMALAAKNVALAFSDEMDIYQFITIYLWFIPVSLIGQYVFVTVASALNATERPQIALTLNLLKSFVLALPLAWLGTHLYGSSGFIASVFITNCISFIMGLYYYHRIKIA